MWCGQPHARIKPVYNKERYPVKNCQKKVLLFPKPLEQPEGGTITIRVGNERFAVHYEIERLPPAPRPVSAVQRSLARPTRLGIIRPLKRKEALDKTAHADGD
jgi:hypothetical protein